MKVERFETEVRRIVDFKGFGDAVRWVVKEQRELIQTEGLNADQLDLLSKYPQMERSETDGFIEMIVIIMKS